MTQKPERGLVNDHQRTVKNCWLERIKMTHPVDIIEGFLLYVIGPKYLIDEKELEKQLKEARDYCDEIVNQDGSEVEEK